MIKEYAGPILDEIGKAFEDLDYSVLWKMVAGREIHGANRIFFHAVGRPELPMKNFAMYLKHFGYRVHVVGDVTCPAIKPGDVFFVVSGTGETKTSLGMVKKCKEIGEIKDAAHDGGGKIVYWGAGGSGASRQLPSARRAEHGIFGSAHRKPV